MSRARALAWWAAGLALVVIGGVLLAAATGDVGRSSGTAGNVPVRVLEPATPAPDGPALVLAHGFAGSAAMMDPMGSALARAGYLVVMPDLPGHGANAEPLADGVLEPAVAAAVRAARERTSGPVAVVGHSMGAGAVTSWATGAGADSPSATVAVSLPSAEELPADPTRPPNLLLLWGSAEQERFVDAALEALRLGYPGAEPGATYGTVADGSARRAVEISGAEHISVIYREQSFQEVAAWLGGGSPRGDARWIGLVLVLLGSVVLTRPILAGGAPAGSAGSPATARVLGRPGPVGTAGILAVAAVGAGIGAAVVGRLGEVVPVAVAGYLMAWFACGAVLLAVAAGRIGLPMGAGGDVVRGIAAGVVLTLGLALPARLTWAAFEPVGPRGWVLAALVVVLFAWLLGEARLVLRWSGWRRAALLAVSRVVVVAALLGAVLVLGAPGFLTLTLPLVIPILALLAVVAGWSRTPLAAAAAQAIPLATAIATTFPLVS